jgi:hypothetical protein
MADSTERDYRRFIVPTLFIGGIVTGLLGIASLVMARSWPTVCLLLLFGGAGAIAMAQLLELLVEIAEHLAAIRAQVGKGVLGLLG